MFRLFRNTYLDFDFLYSSIDENVLASDQYIQDPFFKKLGGEAHFEPPRPFDVYLKEEHDDDWESLWKILFEKGTSKKFYFYTSSDWYCKIMVRYWKSIFTRAESEFLYFLYRTHIQNLKVMAIFANQDLKGGRTYYRDDSLFPSKDEFYKIVASEATSDFLKSLPLEERNYEYLLASKLAGNSGPSIDAFERTLKDKAWKALGSEIEILRNDVLGGIYDLFSQDRKREGTTNFEFSDYLDSFHVTMGNDPKYTWLLDPYVCEGDAKHIQENYSAELFKDFLKGHQQVFSQGDAAIAEDKFYKFIDLVFEEKYFDLLELDIENGFGSMFFNGEERFGVNQLLISYIYDCFRNNKLEALKSFAMEGE